jgi:hypothetical protein
MQGSYYKHVSLKHTQVLTHRLINNENGSTYTKILINDTIHFPGHSSNTHSLKSHFVQLVQFGPIIESIIDLQFMYRSSHRLFYSHCRLVAINWFVSLEVVGFMPLTSMIEDRMNTT